MKRTVPFLAGLLLPLAAVAQSDESCTLPGVLVMEDASGDDQMAPTGEGFADIQSLHMAEPAGSNNLVFTYTMSDLATMPPDILWIIRFITDVAPANGDAENFVAMLTGPDGTAYFVYGTAGPVDGPGGAGPLLFTPAGELDSLSNFNADGTITLALDKSRIAGLNAGQAVYGMIPLTHKITPTDGSMPFMYGFRSASGTVLAMDDAPDGFYEVAGNESCSAGKSGVLGIFGGALSLPALLLLALGGFAAAGATRNRKLPGAFL